MGFVADDLKYAQTVQRRVEIQLLSGERLGSGVQDVNEEAGFVALYAPQHMQDYTTIRKLDLDLIASVTVTDVEWKTSPST